MSLSLPKVRRSLSVSEASISRVLSPSGTCLLSEKVSQRHSLVIASRTAVNDQNRRTISFQPVFYHALRRFDQLTFSFQMLPLLLPPLLIALADSSDSRCCNTNSSPDEQ